MGKFYSIKFNDDNGQFKIEGPFDENIKVKNDEELITKESCFETLEKIIEKADHDDQSCESGGSWQSYDLLDLLNRARLSLEFLKQLLNDK